MSTWGDIMGCMSVITIEQLKAKFEGGDFPGSADYINLIDTLAALPESNSGNVVLNGAGAPSGGTGANGDFYINTSNYDIYGPKTSGSWGSATSLVGPTGATGSTGSQGATGATGAAGTNGSNGATGDTGPTGPGVSSGGTTGQYLTKVDGTNYNTQWSTLDLSGKQDVVTDVSSTEIGYLDGVTSSIQTQLGNKADSSSLTTHTGATDAHGATGAIVGTTNTQTLTNKTLTSPVVSGLALSDSSVVFEGSSADDNETTITVTNPTADRTITLPDATGTVQLRVADVDDTEIGYLNGVTSAIQTQLDAKTAYSAPTIGSTSIASGATVTTIAGLTLTSPTISTITNTGTVTLPTTTDTLVGRTTTDTLTNKTLTSPIINAATITDGVIKGLEEDVNVVASAATGTINFDASTASVWYYTSNATANHTLNFRYSSEVPLNDSLATGDAITLVWLNTNGSTAYYPSAITIDGNSVTPKVPAAITAGNASAIDVYSFTIIKTASATFTVLETQTKFA